jgi:hypothetical protein
LTDDPFDKGKILLEDWKACRNARARGDAVNLQLARDELDKWARHVSYNATWSKDPVEMAECCYQMESHLRSYKEKIIMEILQHGTI